jgi:hypothetical protein
MSQFPLLNNDLRTFVVKNTGIKTKNYKNPSNVDIRNMNRMLSILVSSDYSASEGAIFDYPWIQDMFNIYRPVEDQSGKVLVFYPKKKLRIGIMLVWRFNSQDNVVSNTIIEDPHELGDGTYIISTQTFLNTNSRVLLVNLFNPFCGGLIKNTKTYRSNAVKCRHTMFHSCHKELNTIMSDALTIQIHGMKANQTARNGTGNLHMMMWNGVNAQYAENSGALFLTKALYNNFPRKMCAKMMIASTIKESPDRPKENDEGIPLSIKTNNKDKGNSSIFCWSGGALKTNIQGKFLGSSGRFILMETAPWLRLNPDRINTFARAVDEAITNYYSALKKEIS